MPSHERKISATFFAVDRAGAAVRKWSASLGRLRQSVTARDLIAKFDEPADFFKVAKGCSVGCSTYLGAMPPGRLEEFPSSALHLAVRNA